MEVILMERIEKLGQMGDVVNVKSGYARNFLLPRKKALHANEENRKIFENQRAQLEANNLKLRGEAKEVAAKLEGLTVVLIRQAGEAGQLYGSVNARDIAAEVIEGGFTIDKNQIKLDHPIKTLGVYTLRVNLHPDVSSGILVNVARSADEAATQARTGKAVVSHEEEDNSVTADDETGHDDKVNKTEEAADEALSGDEEDETKDDGTGKADATGEEEQSE